MRTWTVLTLLFVATLLTPYSVSLAYTEKEPSVAGDSTISDNARHAMEYEEAILKMEQHLQVAKDGTIFLTITDAKSLGIDTAIFNNLLASLAVTNEKLLKGELSIEQISLDSSSPPQDGQATQSNCAGVNGSKWNWWGYRYSFNRCRTADLVFALTVGGAAGCTYIGNVPCGVVAAVGAGYIAWLNDRWGRGIHVNVPWTGTSWVWHQ